MELHTYVAGIGRERNAELCVFIEAVHALSLGSGNRV